MASKTAASKRTISSVVMEEFISPKCAKKVLPSPSQCTSSAQRQQRCGTSYQIADKIATLQVMKRQESTIYKPSRYLDSSSSVTPEDRSKLCRWGFDILEGFKIPVQCNIAAIAIGYFDRFLSNRGLRVVEACLDRLREFQLAFITCIVIALKGRENIKVNPTVIAETMCGDMYLSEEIVAMELEILRTLSWHLNGPTAKDFLEIYMELLPHEADDSVALNFFEAAVNMSEERLLDYSLAFEPPSRLALTTVSLLMSLLDSETQQLLEASTWMSRIGFAMGDLNSSPSD